MFVTQVKRWTCSICGEKQEGHDNNAWPLRGRCCRVCDQEVVLPARMILFRRLNPLNETRMAAAKLAVIEARKMVSDVA